MSMLPRPRAILFDWDNTLVDTWPCIGRCTNLTLEAMGLEPWTPAQIRERVAGSLRDTFPKIYGDRWEYARELYYKAFEETHLETLVELSGAGDFVRAAHRAGIYLAVVSNKTGKYLRKEAAHLGWTDLFGRLVGAQDATRDKPAIDPVLLAVQPAGLALGSDVWFVGDAEIDVRCARDAGCSAILVHGLHRATDPVPDFHAADLTALAKVAGF